MILPPGRSANVSSAGCAWKVAPPSALTEITPVNVPSELSRCAQTQSRPAESTASSPRRYAVALEVESNTLIAGWDTQSAFPFQRHHWKYTSCAAEPPIPGPSYENTIATSIPICTRSDVSRSQQVSSMSAYQCQLCPSSVLRYMESQCPPAPSCWTTSSQVAGLPFCGSSRTAWRAAGRVSAAPPPTLMMFWGAPTSSAATSANMSPPRGSEGNVCIPTF